MLVPDPERQWGEYSLGGWDTDTHEQDGVAHVFTRTSRAGLRLPVLQRSDRVLELTSWSPPEAFAEGREEEIEVLLNGVSLAVLAPSSAPLQRTLPCPEPLWTLGDNVLELVVHGTRRSPDWRGIALAEVRYGEPRVPRIETGASGSPVLRLADSTGARWAIERAGAARVEWSGEATGAGHVEVVFTALDPRTGRVEELTGAAARRFPTSGGSFTGELAVPDLGDAIALLSVAWSAPAGVAAVIDRLRVVEQRAPPPPIIFLSIDTLAARHMSLYGYARATTPAIERFAADAVTFDHCVTNAPWTLPSYLSVMSGLFTFSNLRARGPDRTQGSREAYDLFGLADGRWSLAEMLHASGYRTAAFVDSPWLTESSGLEQGFDLYDASAGSIPKEIATGGVAHVVARALEWLDAQRGGEPYFAFLHAFDVHGPYLPPEPFAGRFHGDALYDPDLVAPAGSVAKVFGAIPNYIAPCGAWALGKTCEHGTHALDDVEALYDEGVLAMDAAVGAFLDELRARDLYDDALIVLAADHGETAHESDFYFGHGVMEESVLRVPLVVKLPGSRHAGRRVASIVQLVDLYPTLRELVGLTSEHAHLHGRSLAPLLEGRELEPAPAITSSGVMRQFSVRYDGWKLVVRHPDADSLLATKLTNPLVPRAWLAEHAPEVLEGPLSIDVVKRLNARFGPKEREALSALLRGPHVELYDLARDPDCRTNLAEREPERVHAMQQMATAAAERTLAAQRSVSDLGADPVLSDEAVRELQALGY